jgi:hypothetical protein
MLLAFPADAGESSCGVSLIIGLGPARMKGFGAAFICAIFRGIPPSTWALGIRRFRQLRAPWRLLGKSIPLRLLGDSYSLGIPLPKHTLQRLFVMLRESPLEWSILSLNNQWSIEPLEHQNCRELRLSHASV